MDNLSHSVVGLAAGEMIHRSLPVEPQSEAHSARRRLLLLSCWLASNFPDLDLVLTPLLPEPLGYLLHHRGHTHTLLYALPQAALLFALIWLCWPGARRLLYASRSARIGVAAALAAGFALHLAMDFLNPYGVHPFHPFDSRWFYGDMTFILEPVFWIAFGVPLALMVRRRWLSWLWLSLLLGAPAYFAMRGYLWWGSLALLLVIALGTGLLQRASAEKGRAALLAAFAVMAGFIGIQAAGVRAAKDEVAQSLARLDPASRLIDVSSTAFPANPLCWMVVSLETNEGEDRYRLRHGIVALAPAILPAHACPARFAGGVAGAGPIAWRSELGGRLSRLRTLEQESCHVRAWLRFARMPHITDSDATDVRFAAGVRGNFTTLRLADFAQQPCPQHVPQWDFPRRDVLGG
jgi:inner membrane protein